MVIKSHIVVKVSSLWGWEAERYIATRAGAPIENSLSVCPLFVLDKWRPLDGFVRCAVPRAPTAHASLLSLHHSPLSFVRSSDRSFASHLVTKPI